MRRIAMLTLFCVVAAGCGDDDGPGPSPATYSIIAPTTTVNVRQDLTTSLRAAGLRVIKNGTDTVPGADTLNNPLPRLQYFPADAEIAVVDVNGFVRGLKPGTTDITITGFDTEASVTVTVTPYTATSVVLRVLTDPVGNVFQPASARKDSGVFYALPSNSTTQRLEGIVTVTTGTVVDTVYCNFCVAQTPTRTTRVVNFRSLNPAKATVSNPTNPTLQSTDGGRVSTIDTSATPVGIVMDVPGDGMADTVWLTLKLRPIDSIQIRPGSRPVESSGQGTTDTQWPGDSLTAIALVTGAENFKATTIYRFKTFAVPAWPATTPTASATWTAFSATSRPFLPIPTYESAQTDYLQINSSGGVVANCEFIGKVGCLAPTRGNAAATQAARDSLVIGCVDNGKRLPGLKTNSTELVGTPIRFNPPPGLIQGLSFLRIPGCPLVGGQLGPNIPTPGAYCSSASSTDRLSQCVVWIRARIIDPATGLERAYYYRIIARRS